MLKLKLDLKYIKESDEILLFGINFIYGEIYKLVKTYNCNDIGTRNLIEVAKDERFIDAISSKISSDIKKIFNNKALNMNINVEMDIHTEDDVNVVYNNFIIYADEVNLDISLIYKKNYNGIKDVIIVNGSNSLGGSLHQINNIFDCSKIKIYDPSELSSNKNFIKSLSNHIKKETLSRGLYVDRIYVKLTFTDDIGLPINKTIKM